MFELWFVKGLDGAQIPGHLQLQVMCSLLTQPLFAGLFLGSTKARLARPIQPFYHALVLFFLLVEVVSVYIIAKNAPVVFNFSLLFAANCLILAIGAGLGKLISSYTSGRSKRIS